MMKRPIKFVRVKLRGYSSYLTEKDNIYIKNLSYVNFKSQSFK